MAATKSYSASRRRRQGSRVEQREPFLPTINRLLVLLIFFGAMVLVTMTFYPEWKKLSLMKETLAEDKEHLQELDQATQDREHQLYLIEHDRGYLENIARDRLDLKKSHETIFRFPHTSQPKK